MLRHRQMMRRRRYLLQRRRRLPHLARAQQPLLTTMSDPLAHEHLFPHPDAQSGTWQLQSDAAEQFVGSGTHPISDVVV
jgi:hypothetical protein